MLFLLSLFVWLCEGGSTIYGPPLALLSVHIVRAYDSRNPRWLNGFDAAVACLGFVVFCVLLVVSTMDNVPEWTIYG